MSTDEHEPQLHDPVESSPTTTGIKTSLAEQSLQDLAKTSGVILTSLYVIGLLVVNFSLSQFHVTDFSPFRVRFVAIGAWAALVAILVSVAWRRLSRAFLETTRVPSCAALLAMFVAICLLLAGLGLLAYFGVLNPPWRSAHPFASHTLFILLWLGGLSDVVPDLIEGRKGVGGIAAAVFFGLSFLYSFANSWYQLIPAEYGGGAPVRARLIFDAKFASNHLVPTPESSQVSFPVDILWNGDQNIVVRTSYGLVLQLDRTEVVGIQPRPEKLIKEHDTSVYAFLNWFWAGFRHRLTSGQTKQPSPTWTWSEVVPNWELSEVETAQRLLDREFDALDPAASDYFRARRDGVLRQEKIESLRCPAGGAYDYSTGGDQRCDPYRFCGTECVAATDKLSKLLGCVKRKQIPCTDFP